jgi:dipeptidyl aminopeptidase/acylaminoacyl peptidase
MLSSDCNHLNLPGANEPAWADRYRLANWTLCAVADNAHECALLASKVTGMWQLYNWRQGDKPVQVTKESHGKMGGMLSPDGKWIVYLKDEGGREEGHYVRIPFEGGEAEDLTPDFPPYWGSGFSFDKEGRFVAFMTSDPEYGFRLWRKDEGATPVQLYCHPSNEAHSSVLSHDGSRVAHAQSDRKPDRNLAISVRSTVDGKEITELWDGEGNRVVPVAFPKIKGDNRLLVSYNSAGRPLPAIWNTDSGERSNLKIDLPGEIATRRWSRDGKRILFSQNHEGRVRLYWHDLDSDISELIAHPVGVIGGCWPRSDGKLWMNFHNAATPVQIMELEPETGKTNILMQSENVPPSTPMESVHFAGARGDTIQAYLGLPRGEAPYPTVLHVHGGPAGQVIDSWMPLLQAYIDEGFAVLTLNYHGSTGFGKEFEDSIKGDLMNLELEDYAAARQYLIDEGVAQSDRILITGASYGGFSTLSALTRQPDLWAGGMGRVIIGDLAIMYEDASAPLQGWCKVYTGGTPDEKPDVYRERSPITYVENMRVPLIIIQGRQDSRTPARQCEHFVEAARKAGKDVELHWYDGGHGTLSNEQLILNEKLFIEFGKKILGMSD